MKKRIIFFIVFLFFIVFTMAGKVYKWTDEEGKIHYGDKPTTESSIEEIEIKSSPSEDYQQQNQKILENLKESQKQKEETSEAESKIKQRETKQIVGEECFSNPAEKFGPEWANTFEPIAPRPLTPKEYKNLSDMFRTLAGKQTGIWDGEIDEIICRGTEDSPRRETKQYEVELRIEFSRDNILKIDADIESTKHHYSGREVFSFLLTSDWLRYANIDTIIHDNPIWDVEIISIGKNSLEFINLYYKRTTRRHEFRSINTSKRSFIIKDWYYQQGVLVGMRTWKLKR